MNRRVFGPATRALGAVLSFASIVGATGCPSSTSDADAVADVDFQFETLVAGVVLETPAINDALPAGVLYDWAEEFSIGSGSTLVQAEFRARVAIPDDGDGYVFAYSIWGIAGDGEIESIELRGIDPDEPLSAFWLWQDSIVPENGPVSVLRSASDGSILIAFEAATGATGTEALQFESTVSEYAETGTAIIRTASGDEVTISDVPIPQ